MASKEFQTFILQIGRLIKFEHSCCTWLYHYCGVGYHQENFRSFAQAIDAEPEYNSDDDEIASNSLEQDANDEMDFQEETTTSNDAGNEPEQQQDNLLVSTMPQFVAVSSLGKTACKTNIAEISVIGAPKFIPHVWNWTDSISITLSISKKHHNNQCICTHLFARRFIWCLQHPFQAQGNRKLYKRQLIFPVQSA